MPDVVDEAGDRGGELRLPPDIDRVTIVGAGRRSIIYRASRGGEPVAIKVYRPRFIEKYRRRYSLNIAQYEYDRNRSFYAVDELRPYAARPIAVLGVEDDYSLAFLQEFVEGISLHELARRLGRVPAETIEAGWRIVRAASAAGLYDLDISTRNIKVRRTDAGWMPVVYDFNLVPQYLHPPNPLVALAYLTGVRDKAHRDRRAVRNWARLGG